MLLGQAYGCRTVGRHSANPVAKGFQAGFKYDGHVFIVLHYHDGSFPLRLVFLDLLVLKHLFHSTCFWKLSSNMLVSGFRNVSGFYRLPVISAAVFRDSLG